MGSIRKRGDRWRAEIRRKGQPSESGTFRTKSEAAAWVLEREADIRAGKLPEHSVRDALRRYGREVSPKHRGERWEIARLGLLERDPLAAVALPSLQARHLAEWRERRLRAVSGASVRREMTLLRSVLRMCRAEWGWLRADPMADVGKPASPPARRRRISADEIDRIVMALGYGGGPAETVSDRVALAFLFALETAMRAGEILGLRPQDVAAKSVTLQATKNGDVRRVPLSPRAREILTLLPAADPVFGLDPGSRDALFRKARDRAGVVDLHFHDSRAEAIWRLSKKLDVLELARVIGHRDIKSLMLYYHADADELADRL
jgi:integrase